MFFLHVSQYGKKQQQKNKKNKQTNKKKHWNKSLKRD